MENSKRRTLAEMNIDAYGKDKSMSGTLRLRYEYAVGLKGAGKDSMHVLQVTRIVKCVWDETKVGDFYTANVVCTLSSNGRPVPGADTDRVTCQKCIARFGWN